MLHVIVRYYINCVVLRVITHPIHELNETLHDANLKKKFFNLPKWQAPSLTSEK